MEFRTKIPIPPGEPEIDHASHILLLGSCFVENIGKKLEYYKFNTLQNPFGILFHPAAIANFLTSVVKQKRYAEEDIFFHNERWHCFEAHSQLSNENKEELLRQLNAAIENTHAFLQKTTHVILTLGTAWSYRQKATGRTVGNCHKVPQREFSKELTETTPEIEACVKLLQEANSDATIIFTVSPVRHLKDGFVENQQSKARLIFAVHAAVSEHEKAQYFPAYELMMDELRDYRFYAEDMVHPNKTAVDYIWQRFRDTYMSPVTLEVLNEVEQVQRGLAHRPFNKNSEAHRNFLEKLEQKILELQRKYPSITF